MRAIARWLLGRRWPVAGLAAVVCFGVLAGRFWHPYYGFTKFLQFEQPVPGGTPTVREVEARPIYLYPPGNGYDGALYAQIAFHPLLDSPELGPAIDSLSYRARRILGGALAWTIAGGKPQRIANVYAALNLAVWVVLALVLWRLLRVNDGRAWLAWTALLFSAGVLHPVRLALPDLLAVTLLAAGMLLAERGRERTGLAALALAALARETVLLGVVGWWRGPWSSPRAWITNAIRTLAAAAPLAGWMIYLRAKTGGTGPGLVGLALPAVGFMEKWVVSVASLRSHPEFRWLMITTLLALAALTAQAVYFARPRREDPWWLIGMANVLLMLLFGTAVWEGQPGAWTRVLLPLSLAFTVLVVRRRAALGWIVAGALSVFSGVLPLVHVPDDPREFSTGRHERGAYVVRLGEGWYGEERHRRERWAWTASGGTLEVESWPQTTDPVRVRVGLRALSARPVEVRQGATVIWRGEAGPTMQRFAIDGVRFAAGRGTLEFSTATPPQRESGNPDARALGFAVYNVQIE